jgi:tetratricopeptide (TPR) repeat protein
VAHIPHLMACQATPMAEELRMAAEYARAAGDTGTEAQALGWYMTSLFLGKTPADEVAEALNAIESEQPGPYLGAMVDHARADLCGLAGRLEEARLLAQRVCGQLEALGQHVLRGGHMQHWGRLELQAGNPSGARDVLLEADAILAEAGESSFRSTVQALLASAYERLGERDAALAAIEVTERLGAKEDLANFILTHSVRARLALTDGDLAEAERWARSAADYAARTDFVVSQGEAKLELAQVLAAAGGREEALGHAQEALALFEAKGDQPHAAEARAVLHDL